MKKQETKCVYIPLMYDKNYWRLDPLVPAYKSIPKGGLKFQIRYPLFITLFCEVYIIEGT